MQETLPVFSFRRSKDTSTARVLCVELFSQA